MTRGQGKCSGLPPARVTDVGEIVLPGVRASFSDGGPGEPLVIVAGGREPSLPWLRDLLPGKELWCADSGLVPCMKARLTPSRLLVTGTARRRPWEQVALAETTGRRVFPRRQGFLDLLLAFFRAERRKPAGGHRFGLDGGRFDPLWSQSIPLVGREGRLGACVCDHLEVLFLV